MTGNIKVISYRDALPEGFIEVNTTSRSNDFGKELSPFYLGPCALYHGYVSQNVENGWQFSKIYEDYVDDNGNPTQEYFQWAMNGWASKRAERYPMGKGAVPLFSYWNGEKLNYIEARKKIYIPIYCRAARKTKAYEKLKQMYENGEHIALRDFDGYDHESLCMSLDDVIDNPDRSMGHAFCILGMLIHGL